jgi:hypothetical protein
VLSGFWITRSVIRNPENSSFWPDYLVNRLSRLWLVLIPALLLGGILDWLGSQVLHSTIYEGTSGASSLVRPIQLSMPVLLANSLFLQTIVAPVFLVSGALADDPFAPPIALSRHSSRWFDLADGRLRLSELVRRLAALLPFDAGKPSHLAAIFRLGHPSLRDCRGGSDAHDNACLPPLVVRSAPRACLPMVSTGALPR